MPYITYIASPNYLSKDNMLPLCKRSYFIVAIYHHLCCPLITLKFQANMFWAKSPKSISLCKSCYTKCSL